MRRKDDPSRRAPDGRPVCRHMPERGEAGDALVYRFGDPQHGDWCFVRLPYTYEADGKPHPWIVCNHGNGWTMDGTESKANWSGKTQYGVDGQNDGAYLNPNTPGFRKYSNPTIEAFLHAGYVVCGAQNGGDLLYGNEICVRACVSFYRHMRETYKVERRCFMLGASNGFMTTAGAVRTLGCESVRGIIGQYPLCSLRHAYAYTHRSGVRRAYGIVSDDAADEFAAKAAYADPCAFMDPMSGAVRTVDDWPPTLLVWSSTDQVLPMAEHAVRFVSLLEARGFPAADIQADAVGGFCPHGDFRHFLPETFVSWCESVRAGGTAND